MEQKVTAPAQYVLLYKAYMLKVIYDIMTIAQFVP